MPHRIRGLCNEVEIAREKNRQFVRVVLEIKDLCKTSLLWALKQQQQHPHWLNEVCNYKRDHFKGTLDAFFFCCSRPLKPAELMVLRPRIQACSLSLCACDGSDCRILTRAAEKYCKTIPMW